MTMNPAGITILSALECGSSLPAAYEAVALVISCGGAVKSDTLYCTPYCEYVLASSDSGSAVNGGTMTNVSVASPGSVCLSRKKAPGSGIMKSSMVRLP